MTNSVEYIPFSIGYSLSRVLWKADIHYNVQLLCTLNQLSSIQNIDIEVFLF
jgi:hypothetical protein